MPVVISPQCETKSSSSSCTWPIKDPGLQISQAFQPVRTSKLLHRVKNPQSRHNHFLMSKIRSYLNKTFKISNDAHSAMMRDNSCCQMRQITTIRMLNPTRIIVYSTSQHSTTWWWHYLNAGSDSDQCVFQQSTQRHRMVRSFECWIRLRSLCIPLACHMEVRSFECWIRLGSLCTPPANRVPQIGEIILMLN